MPDHTGLALAGTLLVHSATGALVLAASAGSHAKPPPTYKVRLVAAPAPDPTARPAPDAVDRPAETPAPAPNAKRPPKSTIAAAAPPKEDTKPREAAPRSTPKVELAPGEKPSTGSAVGTVSTEGIEFPFPEYINNVYSQIRLRWNQPQTSLEAEVAFFIQRDGSVEGIKFVKRSGNFAFDLEAIGAVEEAGSVRAFGPLPDGFRSDVLYIRFYFTWQQQ